MELVIERRVCWNRKKAKETPAKETPKATRTPGGRSNSSPRRVRKANGAETSAGNKHAKNFQRPLTEREEKVIQREFLKLNGIFEPNRKDCTRICGLLPEEVTVFQVSGHVTKLHRAAKSGELEMPDRRAYLANIRDHQRHWLTYKGEKYDQMRERKENGRSSSRIRPSRKGKAPRNHRVAR